MPARWPIFATFTVLASAYLAYPYVTLYRLDIAVRQSDAATLRSLVDWYSVREGLKEDICDMVLDEPANARSSNELAPFGAGFVRGMTGNALDHTVTPETFVSLTHGAELRPSAASKAHVNWAFFDGPTRFLVRVRIDADPEPIRVAMELRGMRWRVRRIWLPATLLERAGSGT
jgi:hypothetical protein